MASYATPDGIEDELYDPVMIRSKHALGRSVDVSCVLDRVRSRKSQVTVAGAVAGWILSGGGPIALSGVVECDSRSLATWMNVL